MTEYACPTPIEARVWFGIETPSLLLTLTGSLALSSMINSIRDAGARLHQTAL